MQKLQWLTRRFSWSSSSLLKEFDPFLHSTSRSLCFARYTMMRRDIDCLEGNLYKTLPVTDYDHLRLVIQYLYQDLSQNHTEWIETVLFIQSRLLLEFQRNKRNPTFSSAKFYFSDEKLLENASISFDGLMKSIQFNWQLVCKKQVEQATLHGLLSSLIPFIEESDSVLTLMRDISMHVSLDSFAFDVLPRIIFYLHSQRIPLLAYCRWCFRLARKRKWQRVEMRLALERALLTVQFMTRSRSHYLTSDAITLSEAFLLALEMDRSLYFEKVELPFFACYDSSFMISLYLLGATPAVMHSLGRLVASNRLHSRFIQIAVKQVMEMPIRSQIRQEKEFVYYKQVFHYEKSEIRSFGFDNAVKENERIKIEFVEEKGLNAIARNVIHVSEWIRNHCPMDYTLCCVMQSFLTHFYTQLAQRFARHRELDKQALLKEREEWKCTIENPTLLSTKTMHHILWAMAPPWSCLILSELKQQQQ